MTVISTVLDLAQTDTGLRRASSTLHDGPCPRCGGRDRFYVNTVEDRWGCRGCAPGYHDAIDYLRQMRGMGYRDACDVLGIAPGERPHSQPAHQMAKLEPSPEWRAAATAAATRCMRDLWTRAGRNALTYLRRRGLRDSTIRSAGMGYSAGDQWIEGLWVTGPGPSILIPKRVEGVVYSLKRRLLDAPTPDLRYRNVTWCDTSKRTTYPAGRPHLYGSVTLPGRDVVILTEGELDALLLWQEAGDLIGACTVGSCSTDIPVAALRLLLPPPHGTIRRLVIAMDLDEAGQAASQRLIDRYPGLPWERAMVPRGKDITAYHQDGGNLRQWVQALLTSLNGEETTHVQMAT